MNQSVMRKSALSSAIALSLAASDAVAAPDPIVIENMLFGTVNYVSAGTLNSAGTGAMNSVAPFFYHTWMASQATGFMDTTGAFAGSNAQGAWDYSADIAGMTSNQVAIGIFFDWNGSNGIALLEIFDCIGDVCVGNGIAMQNGPFVGSVAIFSSSVQLTCLDGSATTDPGEAVEITKADLLATCQFADGAAVVDSFDATSANGATISNQGDVLLYTPRDGFEGPDTFSVTLADDSATFDITVSVQVGGALQNNFTMMGAAGGTFGGTNDVVFEWDGDFNTNAVDGSGINNDTGFSDHISIGSPNPFLNFTWTAHHIRVFQGPGTFKFDVTCDAVGDYDNGIVDCAANPLGNQNALTRYMTMTLEANEIGAHILFDWGADSGTTDCGKANCDIDVVNTWKENEMWNGYDDASPKNDVWIGAAGVVPATEENSTIAANWELVSTDVKGFTDINGDFHAEGNKINGAPMLDGAFTDNYANFNKTPDRTGTPPDPIDTEIDDVETGGFAFSIWTMMAGLFSVFGLRRVSRNK